MNKTEFVRELSKKTKLTQKDCANCLNALTQVITKTLKQGDNVTLIGFGKFQVKHRNARKTFNPQTKRAMQLPASKIPQFKAGKAFKQAIS